MTDVTYALMKLLKADAGVTTLVSTRVYREKLPISPTFPAITTDGISGDPWTLNSSGTKPLEGATIQFSCWGELASTSKAVARAVAECLHGYAGTSEGVVIGAISVQSSPDGFCIYDPEGGIYMKPLDVRVNYN